MIFIFIAYCGLDREFVEEVSNDLKQQDNYKLKVWDYQDYPNMEFIDNLHSTDIFVLFVSKRSMTNENVEVEIVKACELESKGQIKKILPLIIDDTYNYSYPFINLESYNYIHVNDHQDALLEIYSSCCKLLRNE